MVSAAVAGAAFAECALEGAGPRFFGPFAGLAHLVRVEHAGAEIDGDCDDGDDYQWMHGNSVTCVRPASQGVPEPRASHRASKW